MPRTTMDGRRKCLATTVAARRRRIARSPEIFIAAMIERRRRRSTPRVARARRATSRTRRDVK